MRASILAGLVGGLLASNAMAAITVVDSYSFDNSTLDGGGIGHDPVGEWNLNDASGGAFSSDAAPGGGAGSASFNGSSNYLSPTDAASGVLAGRTTNYGVELWAKPATQATGERVLFSFNPIDNGTHANDPVLQILQTTDPQDPLTTGDDVLGLIGALHAAAYIGTPGNTTVGDWVHLAIVVADSTTSFYVNGALAGSTLAMPAAIDSGFTLGQKPFGGEAYDGLIDELKIFTFEPGQFNAQTDLSVPEPASLALLAVGSLGLLARRRARR